MAKSNKDFLDLIIKQRSQKKNKKFKGTFLDYLNLLRDDPTVAKLAHVRLRDAIETHGTSYLDTSTPRCRKLFDGERIRVYDYFSSEFFDSRTRNSVISKYRKSVAAIFRNLCPTMLSIWK